MGALSVLNVAYNNLGELVLANGITHCKAKSGKMLYWGKDDKSLGEEPPHGCGPIGVIVLANAINNMGALFKLLMCQNNIHGAEAGKAFADMLAQNTVLKELDLSSQKVGGYGDALDAAFAKEFAVGISDNGALTSLNLSSNNLKAEGARIVAKAVKVTNYVSYIIYTIFMSI
jgi:hypothetical protein